MISLRKVSYFSISICILLIFSACESSGPLEEIVSEINPSIDVSIIRYEEELMAMDSAGEADLSKTMSEKYPAFSEVYFNQVLALPRDKEIITTELKRMVSDTGYVRLYHDVKAEYGDFEENKKEIAQALENYMKVFGLNQVPKVYTFLSGFALQCFLFDDLNNESVALGLDMFLGSDFPYALIDPTNPSFSAYLTRSYDKEHLTKKMVEVLVEDKIAPPQKPDFLSLMIFGGKKLYVMDQILTFRPDSILTEYTGAQLQWCRENETQIWQFFFDANLFYETDFRKFNKLISPAPNSPGMPEEAPGATANYMGWQIIKAYMKRYPKTTIQELLEMNDAQEILDKSRFKPNRTT
jgi:hypothetical protein